VRLLSETLFQHITVDALVAKALETALEVLKAEAGSVLLADPATKQLVFHHSIGKSPVPYGTAIPWDKGISAETVGRRAHRRHECAEQTRRRTLRR
jgi:hypothetical protein